MKKILVYVGVLLAGVMFADSIKPMLQGLPVIGGMFGGKGTDGATE